MNSTRHAGLSDYLVRSRIDPGPARADGSIVLVFDATLRVVLHPAPRGDIVMEGQLTELPAARHTSDRMLETLLETAGRRPASDADCLVLDSPGQRLMLQQRMSADASAGEFEAGLAAFLDALSAWRAELGTL